MTIGVAPATIEVSDLSGGFMPDPAEAAVPAGGTPDASNLLSVAWPSELRVRNGFARITNGRASTLQGTHCIRHLNYYELIDGGVRKRYLVAILSSFVDNSTNNIQVWVYNFSNNTFTRVDTAGRAWAKAGFEHWYAIVEGTYYGGTIGEKMYSWHPTDGWNADPSTPSLKTWVDDIDAGVNPATEYGRDHAFTKGTKVFLSGTTYFSALKGIRYQTWESGQRYSRGERVSRKATIGGSTYWRSYECITSHTADTDNRPGDGSGTPTDYWKKVRLRNVQDEDGVTTADWALSPLAAKTACGTYHGNRLWLRRGDDDNHARLQYSAPARPEKDTDIADLTWNPTDWSPVDDNQGDGGGWLDVPFSGKGDAIRALHSFGNYLIIAGRWQSYVLSGLSESSWTLRKLGNWGAVGPQAVTEQDGLVYMLGRHGVLAVTDGTSIQEVPGMGAVRAYLKTQLDASYNNSLNWQPTLASHNGYIYITIPNYSGTDLVMVYDPRYGAFWKTDLRMLDIAVGESGGVNRLWFSTPITPTGSQTPCIFQYKDDPGNETFTDDDWEALSGSAATNDIAWSYRSNWFQFGMARNERKIRRAWALVAGEASQSVLVRLFKNFVPGSHTTTATRTLTGQATQDAEFVEAAVGTTNAYAVGIQVSGNCNALTAVHGFGLDTEHRRTRFHV